MHMVSMNAYLLENAYVNDIQSIIDDVYNECSDSLQVTGQNI